MAEFRLSSPAFEHDEELPLDHTADGDDLSPPLRWTAPPEGTKELVVICDDPDAESGVFTHWLVYGIYADTFELPEGLPDDAVIDEPVSLVQGLNEFDAVGYTGPTPTDDDQPRHRVFFRLFALDRELDLPPGVTRAELRKAAKDHIIGQAELVAIV